jgi:hypothetical protein
MIKPTATRFAQVTLMNSDRMFELAQALAAAKSRQDLAAAMKLLDKDMLLEAPAFGTKAQGLPENEAVLRKFFKSFPDYSVELEGCRRSARNRGDREEGHDGAGCALGPTG